MLFEKWGGGGVCGWKFKVQEYLWQSTPQLAPLSDSDLNDIATRSPTPPFSSQSHCCLLPSSPSLIDSSYLLRFMKNSANSICRRSLDAWFSLQGGAWGWGWAFWLLGWNCYHLQPVREQQFSGKRKKWSREGGWWVARCWGEITQSVLALSKCRRIGQGLVSQTAYEAETAFCSTKC